MADEVKNKNEVEAQQGGEQQKTQQEDQQTATQQDEQQEKPKDSIPSIEELMAKLAEANAEKESYKKANDRLSKSEAEMKRKLRATQTAEEQKKEEEEEAKRIAEEEKENMRKELNHIKAVAAYKNVKDENTVELLVEAVSEADHSTIATIIENERQKAAKAAVAEYKLTIPQVNAGSGDDDDKKDAFREGFASVKPIYGRNKGGR